MGNCVRGSQRHAPTTPTLQRTNSLDDLRTAAEGLENARTSAQQHIPPQLAGLQPNVRARVISNADNLLQLARARTANPGGASGIAEETGTSHSHLAETIRTMTARFGPV